MTALRFVAALLAVLACAALFACDDDDDDGASPTPTVSKRETPTDTGEEPSPDEKLTPTDEASPNETVAPGGDTPTQPPPAAEGIRATLVADQVAYLGQFQGRNLQEEACFYSPVTRITECIGAIKYAIDPPIVGQDIECVRGVVDGQAEYIRCTSVEPEQSNIYEIQA